MSTLGERFKEVRITRGYNQRDFASELGISQNHISSIENDKEKPSVLLKKLVCYRFNVDESWLSNGVGTLLPESNIPIVDGSINEDELFVAKYGELRVIIDSLLKERSGDELKYTVLALNYLVGMLACSKVDPENKSKFLATVCSVVDEMEKLAFQSSTISNYGKKDYGHFLRYKNMAEKRISAIEQQIRIMNNVYLKQYGVDKDIVL